MSRFFHGTSTVTSAQMMHAYTVQPAISFTADRVACTCTLPLVEMAAISTKGKVQVQATLSAVKEMAGWTVYACIICALVTVLVPWKKRDISHDTREYLTKMEN